MLRGFWVHGHFRYGNRVEIDTFPEQLVPLRTTYMKLRTGSFYDNVAIHYEQSSYLYEILFAEYSSSQHFCQIYSKGSHPNKRGIDKYMAVGGATDRASQVAVEDHHE